MDRDISTSVPLELFAKMPEDMPDGMSDRMPEDMPDKML